MNYSDLSPPELFSICAHGGDVASWQEFVRRFNPVIARSVIRVVLRHGTADKSLIDDLMQETYLKICASQCKLLRTFVPQQADSAFGFLKVVAASVAHDFFKSRLAVKRATESTAGSIEESSFTSRFESTKNTLNATERAVLIEQIDRTLSVVVPPGELQRARTIFWLYYRSGFTASAIAALPALDLTTKGVESLLFRLTRLLREKISSAPDSRVGDKKGFHQAESF